MKYFIILFSIFILFSCGGGGSTPATYNKSVSLQWDSCPAEDNVSGYVLYYGTKARGYTKAVDIGNTTGANINSLEDGVTYYFAVTAYRYDAAGNREESDYSEELKT